MLINLYDLGAIILFLFGGAIGIYILILLKNLIPVVQAIKEIVNTNKDNINQTLKTVPLITKNISDITDTAKDELKAVQNTLHSISETADMTAAAANTIKSGFIDNVTAVFEVINLIKKFLFKDKPVAKD